ncbi:MAG: hypothetical protein ACIAS6_07790 [Phycisphaerales bacterium JB060]
MAGRARVGQARTGRGVAVGLAAGLLVSAVGLPGCAGWDTWPPTDPVDQVPNRDDAAIAQTMTLALGRVIADYPPRGDQNQRVAVNLPGPLVGQAVYRRVARNAEAEPGVNRLVEPLSESNMNLPIYHVAGVRVRSGKAEIDILRPIFGVDELQRAELTNERAYEGYTVRLSGGFRPWHVTWVERFTPGVIPTPALNPINAVTPSGLPDPASMPPQETEEVDELPGDEWEPAEDPASEPAMDPADEPGLG